MWQITNCHKEDQHNMGESMQENSATLNNINWLHSLNTALILTMKTFCWKNRLVSRPLHHCCLHCEVKYIHFLDTLSPCPHTLVVLHSCWPWLVPKPFALLFLQQYLRSWDLNTNSCPLDPLVPPIWFCPLMPWITELSQTWEEWTSRHVLVERLQFLLCGLHAVIK